ncbi:MAG: MnhB domain-containing protein [Haloarculaceae archaeon]
MARTVARVVFPIVLLVAVALLLQGHNLPGGGFIAGVLTAAAFALVYIIYGLEFLEAELLHRRPTVPYSTEAGIVREYGNVFAAGLAIAAGSGIAAILLGQPFLTQAVVFLEHVPVFGELEFASAFAFDFGVYFVVVGALLTILAVVGAE